MIQFSGRKIYRFFLTWCMGLIFLFSSYTFMEDVLYRKFLGLNFDNSILAVILCVSALFFGAVMAYVGFHMYDWIFITLRHSKKETAMSLNDLLIEVEMQTKWPSKSHKKQYKRIKENVEMHAMLFGTSFSCLTIFTTKLILEMKLYNYSNIQYVLMFGIFSLIFYKELTKSKTKLELVRNTCMNKMSDLI